MKKLKLFTISVIVSVLILQNIVHATGISNPGIDQLDESPLEKVSFATTYRVNLPYFEDSVSWARSAIFWFSKNELSFPGKNYVDVRMAYTDAALKIRITVIDYYLWYDNGATLTSDLTQYDAVALYLDTQHDQAGTPQLDDYKLLLGLSNFQDTAQYKRDWRGDGSNWDGSWGGTWDGLSGLDYSSTGGPNDNSGNTDYGWTGIISIPWELFGLSNPPDQETLWGFGVLLYDRDDNPPLGAVDPQFWPETFQEGNPASWGEIHFGEANYIPKTDLISGEVTIRASSPTDNTVEDAWMGGGGLCAGGHEGGSEINHGDDVNLFAGSETAATHFPCFNKSYLRFQLDAMPQGVEVISAALTLHLWGNADQSIAPPYSYIHLFSVIDDWDEMAIHWNNAPLAHENISAVRVYPYIQNPIVWPGDPYTWDATKAVAEAYQNGESVSFALYSSDSGRDTSKYFKSSEEGDWNLEARPTLVVNYGLAGTHLEKSGSTPIATRDDMITYTLTWEGIGEGLTLIDQLPIGFSTPTNLQVTTGNASYDGTMRQIQWSGSPTQGETITLTYQVSVLIDGPLALTNTASLSAGAEIQSTDSFVLLIDPLKTFLPIVIR